MTDDLAGRRGLTDPHVLSSVWLGVIGPQGILTMPYIVSDLSSRLELSLSQAGLFASAALVGACCAGISLAALAGKMRWRLQTNFYAALLAVSYGLLAVAQSHFLCLLLMFLAGAGMGALLSLSLTAVEQTGQQTRAVGLIFGAQAALGSLLSIAIPILQEAYPATVYLALTASSLTVFLAARFIQQPSRQPVFAAAPEVPAGKRPNSASLMLALVGWGCINFANGGYWPLIGELARTSGHSSATISSGVSAALMLSIFGGFAAMLLGRRLGELTPLILIGIGTAIANQYIAAGTGSFGFIAAMCLFGFLWNFGPPYQLPVVSQCDATGRGMPLALVFMKLFMAFAPAVYGFVGEYAGTFMTGSIAAGFAILSTLLLVGLSIAHRDRRAPVLEAAH